MIKELEYNGDDYWAALYRRRRIIALTMVLSAVFSAFFSFIFTPLYQATIQFYVPQDVVASRGSPQRGLIRVPGLRDQARTYVAVLESRDAHSAVAEQLEDRSTDDVLRAADFDVTPAASLIVYARDKDPAVAKRMVELFFEYFKSFHSLRLEDTIKVLERPSVSANPVFPINVLNTLIGAIGGLLLGIIYALFLDYLQVRALARKLKQLEGQDWFEDAVSEEQNRHSNQ
jgi:capsular polysaccharide biosynthesis protein